MTGATAPVDDQEHVGRAGGVRDLPGVPVDPAGAADRAWHEGALSEAGHHADGLLGDPAAPLEDRVRAAIVLAAVLAHRGLLAQSAALHTWVASTAPRSATPGAAVALIGTGTPVDGVAPTEAPVPTLRAGTDALLARGLRASVRAGGSAAALADLARAAGTLRGCGRPAPADESPAVLAALVALHRGEPDLAAPLLDRALADDLGGAPFRSRHRLWRAWVAMAAGDPGLARDHLSVAVEGGCLGARDELVAVGVEAGLARRAGDTRALLGMWSRVRAALLDHQVDLWSLLPLGELVVVAARLEETAWTTVPVADAEALLTALDRPPLWAAPWHWHAFLAAVTAAGRQAGEDRDAATGPAERLTAAAAVDPDDPVTGVLADAAGRWLDVLGGHVDTDAVTAAAGRLRDVGLPWDGARLAKEAAVRTTDRKAVGVLLGCARAVLPSATADAAPAPLAAAVASAAPTIASTAPADAGPAADPFATVVPGPRTVLSEREREIAALLLEGMTHRQVGDRLFIAPKTVEHHVGRIRGRLGSRTRTDLFADLRACLGTPT